MEPDLQRETEQQKGNANEAAGGWGGGRGESVAPHQLLQAGRRLSQAAAIPEVRFYSLKMLL